MIEITNDVVRVLHPLPIQEEVEDLVRYHQQVFLVQEDREIRLKYLMDEQNSVKGNFDPLLHELRELSDLKKQIEEQIRLLLAYAREFVRPEPYKLATLASATQMSISGVRKAYSHKEKVIVARNIKRGDRHGNLVPPGEETPDASSRNRTPGLDEFGRFSGLRSAVDLTYRRFPTGRSTLPPAVS